MQLVVIGSGTAVPQEQRSAPCYLIRAGGGHIVVDLGPGSIWGLLRHCGISTPDIGLVLLSHLHMDHCADLAPLLFSLRSRDLTRENPLGIVGPAGLKDFHERLKVLWKNWIEPTGYDLSLEEWDGREFEWKKFSIRAAPTRHSIPNLAWRVDLAGSLGVVLTGDGESTEELVRMSRSGDHVLIAECSAGPDAVMEGHLNPAQAGDLARRCGSSSLVLSHINPGPPPQVLAESARESFKGPVLVAEDGMVIDL